MTRIECCVKRISASWFEDDLSFFGGGKVLYGRRTDSAQVPIVCDLGGRRLLSTRVRGAPPLNRRCGACGASSASSPRVAGALGRLVLTDGVGAGY